MKIALCFVSFSILVSSLGCAHMHKVDPSEKSAELPTGVKVGIGSSEVKEGDKVVVTKSTCVQANRKGKYGTVKYNKCEDSDVGFAIVLKVIDSNSALVEPLNGLVLDSSMKVEKQKM